MKDKRILYASIGTALIGGAIFLIIRKLVKNSQFAELMLAIKQDEAMQKGELSYLKAFDPSFVDKPDPLNRARTLYTAATVETMVDKLREAVKGLGTDERTIMSLYSKIESQQKMAQLAKRYAIKYMISLLDVLTSELDQDERTELFSIIAAKPEIHIKS